MLFDVSFVNKFESTNCMVCFISESSEILGNCAIELDKSNGNFITNAVQISNFKGKFKDTALLISPLKEIKHVLLVGTGNKKLTQTCMETLGGVVYSALKNVCDEINILSDGLIADDCDNPQARLAFGLNLKSWEFDKYKTKKTVKKLCKSVVLSASPDESLKIYEELNYVASGINLTRELVSEPANVLYPKSFVEIVSKELLPLGVKVDIYDENEMHKMGLGALLGVAQGSKNPPNLLVMRWEGSQDKPMAFVGKGVTFDSGGISIKPSSGMEDMKHDMAGAAAVVGLMKTIALNKLQKNIVCIAGLVENMPSGSAQRPGDIVKSMSGQTIEVLNTDAEGRLTLADTLWYTQEQFNPEFIIDLATLTGAIVVCLGHEYAGLFSNCDELSDKISAASKITGEKVWRLPMNDYFDSTVESNVADLKNITSGNVRAGSITAAQFLKRFVNGCNWAHLDIAGVESTERDLGSIGVGATGFGVRLLYKLVKDYEYNKNSTEIIENEDSATDGKHKTNIAISKKK